MNHWKTHFSFNTLLTFHAALCIQTANPKDNYNGTIRNEIITNITNLYSLNLQLNFITFIVILLIIQGAENQQQISCSIKTTNTRFIKIIAI